MLTRKTTAQPTSISHPMPSLLTAILLLLLPLTTAFAANIQINDTQAAEIGRRIWRNECAGTIEGLTSWNAGEHFASLGICHFIWYPSGKSGPFTESFPALVRFLKTRGHQLPQWLSGPCPWNSREEFLRDFQSPRMVTLRNILKNTIPDQARFAILRLNHALPKILSASAPHLRTKIEKNFHRVLQQPLGPYALVDYVNFKGEGTSPSERYNGYGWGLLQVLETMDDTGPPLRAFSRAADTVLTRRVRNAPPSRNESRWLPGWRNRLSTYTQ